MKWETYKAMTDAQKEEYNYKFAETPRPPFQSMTMTGLVWWMMISVFILSLYISYTSDQPELIELRPKMFTAFTTFATQMTLWLTVMASYLVVYLIQVGLFVYQKRKWLKQNGIETKP